VIKGRQLDRATVFARRFDICVGQFSVSSNRRLVNELSREVMRSLLIAGGGAGLAAQASSFLRVSPSPERHRQM